MSYYRWQRIVHEVAPILFLTLLLELMGGRLLMSGAEKLLTPAILLALLPMLNATGGNVGVILGARLSSGLHTGTVTARGASRSLRRELEQAGLMGLCVYTTLAILIYLGSLAFRVELELEAIQLLVIMVGSGLLIILLVLFLTVGMAFWSYRHGLDPDNLVPPAVTTACDLAGIISLLVMVGLVV